MQPIFLVCTTAFWSARAVCVPKRQNLATILQTEKSRQPAEAAGSWAWHAYRAYLLISHQLQQQEQQLPTLDVAVQYWCTLLGSQFGYCQCHLLVSNWWWWWWMLRWMHLLLPSPVSWRPLQVRTVCVCCFCWHWLTDWHQWIMTADSMFWLALLRRQATTQGRQFSAVWR